MKHYSDKELDTKIQTFLSKKLQKYPELVLPHEVNDVLTRPSFSTKLMHSLTTINPLVSN